MNHRVNDVLRDYEDTPIKLSVRLIGDADNASVLIEGDATELEFLSKVILAIATNSSEQNFHMAPRGPGFRYFSIDSGLGVYIQKVVRHEHESKNPKG